MCRESVVVGKRFLMIGLLLAMGFGPLAGTSAPGPSETALQEKYVGDDGKPTSGSSQGSSGPSAWRAVGSMLLVLGLCGGGLWAFRKWGANKFPGSGGTRLKVEETLALGDRRFVSILRVDEEKFLIALSPHGVSLISRIDNVEAGGPPIFSDALERMEHHVEINGPMAVKDMEAMIRRENP
jgi:flagellar biogenesis protein FliO